MKVVVAMDGDGHYNVAKLFDREKAKKVLLKAQDGCYYDDVINDMPREDYENFENHKFTNDIEWDRLIRFFVQRGTFEIVDL
jgi:hypothetical protein